MKGKWNRLQGLLAAIGLLVLILDSAQALEGARAGIELCIKTVIPSLFPFFVLSILLTSAFSGHVSTPVQRMAAALGIPKVAAPVLIPAVLGGYPVGAKCVGDLYNRNQISKTEAERLLAFCSNAGPSFLFGMVSGFFPEKIYIWLLWFLHILSAALTAIAIPAEKSGKQEQINGHKTESTDVILSAAKAMCLVCCWVIVFRTILSFLNVWAFWMLPDWTNVLFTGMLELTNGCCELLLIPDVKLRFVLASCLLAFGGICVLLQTISVTDGLYLGYYIKGKLMQTLFSFLMSCAVTSDKKLIFLAIVLILVMLLRKIQKRDSNLLPVPV